MPDKELARARARRWYQNNKDVAKARIKAWAVAHPEERRAISARHEAKRDRQGERRAIREQVIAHYGSVCVCCGETNPKFLTFDHINNDGAARRRKHAGQAENIKREGFPKDIRLLCWNCNCGRYYNGGVCPHEETV